MKQPTTPYSIEVQKNAQITRDFLLSQGWTLKEEMPLFESFSHPQDESLICSIGLYGEFSMTQLHWMNKTPERFFSTLNRDLTKEDYFTIIRLLNIHVPTP